MRFAVALLLLFAGCSADSGDGPTKEREPNDNSNDATTLGDGPGRYEFRGELGNDQDWFRIGTTEAGTARLHIRLDGIDESPVVEIWRDAEPDPMPLVGITPQPDDDGTYEIEGAFPDGSSPPPGYEIDSVFFVVAFSPGLSYSGSFELE